jgi:hypothetical protein
MVSVRQIGEELWHCVSASPLDPVRTAVTVRKRNGKVSTTDGGKVTR